MHSPSTDVGGTRISTQGPAGEIAILKSTIGNDVNAQNRRAWRKRECAKSGDDEAGGTSHG